MTELPLWEVFVRARRGLGHLHVGSVRAADATLARQNARDLYTRRGEGVSIWVVRSTDISATDPDDSDMLFDPALDKEYRYPNYFELREGVQQL
jgi:ring-1,2-phenylacetyl-CoA epoxidase subunit PaaB